MELNDTVIVDRGESICKGVIISERGFSNEDLYQVRVESKKHDLLVSEDNLLTV